MKLKEGKLSNIQQGKILAIQHLDKPNLDIGKILSLVSIILVEVGGGIFKVHSTKVEIVEDFLWKKTPVFHK